MKKVGKNRSLGTLIQVVVSLLIVIAVILVAIVAIISFNNMLDEKSQTESTNALNVVNETFNKQIDTLYVYSQILASDDSFKSALVNNDHQSAVSILSERVELMGITYISATDSDGIMLARTNNPDVYGDDVSQIPGIALALNGIANTGAGVGSTSYNLVSCVPVFDEDGKVIGEVNACVTLSGNQELINLLKNTSGTDCALYMGDICTATTINGLADTTLPENIVEIVMNQEQEFTIPTVIDGISYLISYTPIRDFDGSVSGVIMSGVDMTSVNNQTRNVTIIIIIISIVIMVISNVLFMLLLSKRLKKPLKKIVFAAVSIENGNVDNETKQQLGSVKTHDEIGTLARSIEGAVTSIERIAADTNTLKEAADKHDLTISVDISKHEGIYKTIINIVNTLFDNIKQVVMKIKEVSDDIDKNSELVASVSQSLAQGTTEQASTIEELAATISEISVQVKSNTESTENANEISTENMQEVQQGSASMDELLSAINEINDTSIKISNIIKAIEDIAFQTNILALNASVEAARAGAAGKGFAVVAEEVKNLATRSAQEASNTTTLINDSLTSVNRGTRIAQETAERLSVVVQKTDQVDKIIGAISEATRNENSAVSQVNTAINQISDVVQSNSATAEETSAASEELSLQAAKLNQLVKDYKI